MKKKQFLKEVANLKVGDSVKIYVRGNYNNYYEEGNFVKVERDRLYLSKGKSHSFQRIISFFHPINQNESQMTGATFSELTKKAKTFEQWFEELYLAKGGMETRLLRLEDVESTLQEHIKNFPQGIIEVGGITLGNFLLLKQWFDTLEKIVGLGKPKPEAKTQ